MLVCLFLKGNAPVCSPAHTISPRVIGLSSFPIKETAHPLVDVHKNVEQVESNNQQLFFLFQVDGFMVLIGLTQLHTVMNKNPFQYGHRLKAEQRQDRVLNDFHFQLLKIVSVKFRMLRYHRNLLFDLFLALVELLLHSLLNEFLYRLIPENLPEN